MGWPFRRRSTKRPKDASAQLLGSAHSREINPYALEKPTSSMGRKSSKGRRNRPSQCFNLPSIAGYNTNSSLSCLGSPPTGSRTRLPAARVEAVIADPRLIKATRAQDLSRPYLSQTMPSRSTVSFHRAASRQENARHSTLIKRNTDLGTQRRKRVTREIFEEARRDIDVGNSPLTKRATAPTGSMGQMHGALGRPDLRPTSEASLNQAQNSVHSSNSGHSMTREFKVRALDIISPHPTLRPGSSFSPDRSLGPSRSSQKHDRDGRSPLPISEEIMSQSRTIDELADDLDARAVREIMEKEQRRRTAKRKRDEERATKKLQRTREKQRAEDTEMEDPFTDPKKEPIGLGIEEPLTAAPAPLDNEAEEEKLHDGTPSPSIWAREVRKDAEANEGTTSPSSWIHVPEGEVIENDKNQINEPIDLAPTQVRTPNTDVDEPVHEIAQEMRMSTGSMQMADIQHRKASLASNAYDRDISPTTEPMPSDRRASDQSNRRWGSFFRRSSSKPKPDSFTSGRPNAGRLSATSMGVGSSASGSRDSIHRPPPVAASTRRGSGKPKRVVSSKFKEDLPDFGQGSRDPFPLSPPDSRVQSPEAAPPLPGSEHSQAVAPSSKRYSFSNSSETLGQSRMDIISPIDKPPGTAMSQSLASVDSEASWLSGRPGKRGSSQPMRASVTSLGERFQGTGRSSEELGDTSPDIGSSSAMHMSRGSYGSNVGEAHMFKDVEDGNVVEEDMGEMKVREGMGRRPTLVSHHLTTKSQEGLLRQFVQGESAVHQGTFEDEERPGTADAEGITPGVEYDEGVSPAIERATSLNMQRHSRHISTGSARLLDITKASPSPSSSPNPNSDTK
jgi:hypothetical protein